MGEAVVRGCDRVVRTTQRGQERSPVNCAADTNPSSNGIFLRLWPADIVIKRNIMHTIRRSSLHIGKICRPFILMIITWDTKQFRELFHGFSASIVAFYLFVSAPSTDMTPEHT